MMTYPSNLSFIGRQLPRWAAVCITAPYPRLAGWCSDAIKKISACSPFRGLGGGCLQQGCIPAVSGLQPCCHKTDFRFSLPVGRRAEGRRGLGTANKGVLQQCYRPFFLKSAVFGCLCRRRSSRGSSSSSDSGPKMADLALLLLLQRVFRGKCLAVTSVTKGSCISLKSFTNLRFGTVTPLLHTASTVTTLLQTVTLLLQLLLHILLHFILLKINRVDISVTVTPHIFQVAQINSNVRK